jgi:adenosylcobinamide-GDP ribazoletransferase
VSASALARAPLAAVSFLTRLPVGRLVEIDAADLRRSVPLFPVVGGAVGGVAGLAADALADPLTPLLAGAIAVGVAALLTGAMHLDALADTADGFGATTRDRALEVMRDPSLGAFGVTALVVVLLVDAGALAGLGASGDAALAGLAAGAAGRAAMLPLAAALPTARPGPGQGRALENVGIAPAVAAQVLAVALALPAGVAGLTALLAAWIVACALGVLFARRYGGVTGDLLGATAKLAETAALVVALALLDT